jgi:hypothetical protein
MTPKNWADDNLTFMYKHVGIRNVFFERFGGTGKINITSELATY